MSAAKPAAGAKSASPFRMVVTSFAAGVGAMVFAGLVAPIMAEGGLSMSNANASSLEPQTPLIAPLDVEAVQKELARAEQTMGVTQRATDAAMQRLERLD